MRITERAPAKINLALHVRARRPDGYHEIETLFAFCRDGDTVTVSEAQEDSFAMTGPFAPGLASDGGNLVLAARDAFAAAFGALPPLAITLDKQLPVASGIGGGSADAAATLRALGRLQGVTVNSMVDVALSLGSDVPACLLGRSAIGKGRGEALTPIYGLTDVPVLLINPGKAISTAAVFNAWEGIDRGPFVRHPGLVPASKLPHALPLEAGWMPEQVRHDDWVIAAVAGRNDLETPARKIAPVVDHVLEQLTAQPGVTLARMSGSGATCFALFDSESTRVAARSTIAASHPDWWYLESALA